MRIVVEIQQFTGIQQGRMTFGFGSTYTVSEEQARLWIAEGKAKFVEIPDQPDLDDDAYTKLLASFAPTAT